MPMTSSETGEDKPSMLLRCAWASIMDGCYDLADEYLVQLAVRYKSEKVLGRLADSLRSSRFASEVGIAVSRCKSADSVIYLWCGEVAGDIMEGRVTVREAFVHSDGILDMQTALSECEMEPVGRACLVVPPGVKRSMYAYENRVGASPISEEWGDVPEFVTLAMSSISEMCKAISTEPQIWMSSTRERRVVIGCGFGFPFIRRAS